MKIVEKNKDKKQKPKKKPIIKTKKEQVLIVAQEIKFARLLSNNEKKTRDRALKTLKKWLSNCFEKGYKFKETDFSRIWKGLFYAVWMSDKPLVQEELCESIAAILDQFPPAQIRPALLMVRVGWRALGTEWYGIDHHRLDKCLMLVRRYLRGSFRCLQRCGWSLESCRLYAEMLSGKGGILAVKTPLYARNASSMILHITDCYLEELAKVSQGDIPGTSLSELLRPFCAYMCGGEAPVLCAACRRVLTALVRQSELGLRYRDKTRAWQNMGCPEGGPDALELVSDDDADDEVNGHGASDDDDDDPNKPLDPRAGRVDVLLPTLPVPCDEIAAMLRDMVASVGSKAHKRARICLQRFQQLAQAQYPLPVSDPAPLHSDPLPPTGRAARALRVLEKRLATQSDELALRGLNRKHRKRLLAKSRAGQSIVDDVQRINSANGDWQVEDAEPETKKKKQKDTSDKENKNKKRKLEPKQNGVAKKQKLEKKEKINKNKQNSEESKVQKTKVNNVGNGKNVDTNKKIKKVAEKHVEKKLNGIVKEKKVPLKEKSKKISETLKNGNTTVRVNKKLDKNTEKTDKSPPKLKKNTKTKNATVVVNKVKKFQKQLSSKINERKSLSTPKKVKFVLKNNSMQGTIDYYKSVRQSPSIPFDSSKIPVKTNLKPSTPSPINPFFKKKLRMK